MGHFRATERRRQLGNMKWSGWVSALILGPLSKSFGLDTDLNGSVLTSSKGGNHPKAPKSWNNDPAHGGPSPHYIKQTLPTSNTANFISVAFPGCSQLVQHLCTLLYNPHYERKCRVAIIQKTLTGKASNTRCILTAFPEIMFGLVSEKY